MTRRYIVFFALLVIIATVTAAAGNRRDDRRGRPVTGFDAVIDDHARDMVERGRQVFRFDTFGDEDFWGGALQLHKAIAGARLGGVGPGVSPRTALAVGRKVDAEALPEQLIGALRRGRVDLDDPGVTVALLRLNAVLGVTGVFDSADRLQSMGIQCAQHARPGHAEACRLASLSARHPGAGAADRELRRDGREPRRGVVQ